MDTKQAEKAIKAAYIAGFIAAGLNLFSAIALLATSGEVPLNPGIKTPFSPFYQLINAVFVVTLAYGICKKLFACAIILPANALLRAIYAVLITERPAIIVFTAIFLFFYILGIIGILTIHWIHQEKQSPGKLNSE